MEGERILQKILKGECQQLPDLKVCCKNECRLCAQMTLIVSAATAFAICL